MAIHSADHQVNSQHNLSGGRDCDYYFRCIVLFQILYSWEMEDACKLWLDECCRVSECVFTLFTGNYSWYLVTLGEVATAARELPTNSPLSAGPCVYKTPNIIMAQGGDLNWLKPQHHAAHIMDNGSLNIFNAGKLHLCILFTDFGFGPFPLLTNLLFQLFSGVRRDGISGTLRDRKCWK